MKRHTLEELQPLIWSGRYAIKSHAVRHALAEGFTEKDIVHALGCGRELAVYPEDKRMLVLGYITVSTLRIPLHIVLDYRSSQRVDVVTAFIPDNPYRIYSRERVAILLAHDRNEPRALMILPKSQQKARMRSRIKSSWRMHSA